MILANKPGTIVRRIRRSESNELSGLFRSDKRWSKYFSRHKDWIKRALEGARTEDRVVFGSFELYFGVGDTPKSRLVACLFLEKSEFEENLIEFKNLILPSASLELDTQILLIAKQLIENATRFCGIRGIQKIEIELPQEEHGIISIFLSLGFKIIALREKYNPSTLVCILERSMGDIYYGDPFDRIKLAKWLLRRYLPCKIERVIREGDEGIDGLVKIFFEGQYLSKAFSKENKIGYEKRLQGVMLVLENAHESEEETTRDIVKIILYWTSKNIWLKDYFGFF